ncbi:MAG: hypothetical protein ACK4YF_07155 [Exilispira sp.]
MNNAQIFQSTLGFGFHNSSGILFLDFEFSVQGMANIENLKKIHG